MGFWIMVAIIVFIATGGVGAMIKLIEGRRQHRLDLKEREARIAEARAREHEIEYKRAELEYREALLELERFDRRTGGGAAGAAAPPDPAEPDPPERPGPPAGT